MSFCLHFARANFYSKAVTRGTYWVKWQSNVAASIGSGMREEKLDDFARFSHKSYVKIRTRTRQINASFHHENIITYEVEKAIMYEILIINWIIHLLIIHLLN